MISFCVVVCDFVNSNRNIRELNVWRSSSWPRKKRPERPRRRQIGFSFIEVWSVKRICTQWRDALGLGRAEQSRQTCRSHSRRQQTWMRRTSAESLETLSYGYVGKVLNLEWSQLLGRRTQWSEQRTSSDLPRTSLWKSIPATNSIRGCSWERYWKAQHQNLSPASTPSRFLIQDATHHVALSSIYSCARVGAHTVVRISLVCTFR